MDQTTCQRAFADGFHDEPASNIMAFSDYTQDDCASIPWENMESTICLPTEWTLGLRSWMTNLFTTSKLKCKHQENSVPFQKFLGSDCRPDRLQLNCRHLADTPTYMGYIATLQLSSFAMILPLRARELPSNIFLFSVLLFTKTSGFQTRCSRNSI